MKISAEGLALIRRFEGFVPVPYLCPAGYWTVGYGHVIAPGEVFGRVSEAEAEQMLAQDVTAAEHAVSRLISVGLTPSQFDALVSFTFNVGAAALERSTLRRRVNGGWHAEVPGQLLRWIYAGGRVMPGLVRRREAEGRLYIS